MYGILPKWLKDSNEMPVHLGTYCLENFEEHNYLGYKITNNMSDDVAVK